MKKNTLETLLNKFPYLTKRESTDWPAVNVPSNELASFVQAIHEDESYEMLVDISGVDWSKEPKKKEDSRFSVVYHFFSLLKKEYLRVVVDCENDKDPKVGSIASLYPAADWHEREAYDMFGIKFIGHPNLKRILMWDDYPYYPLRKEFPLAGIETELPALDVAEETKAKVQAAPMMGGPFCSSPTGFMSDSEPVGRDESWTEHKKKPKDFKDG